MSFQGGRRRTRGVALWACHALTLLYACGSGRTEPPPVAPSPPRRAEAARAEREEKEGPLALPDDVVLAARWRDPRALLALLEEWAPRGTSYEKAFLARLGRPRHPVDLSAPIELVVRLDRGVQPPDLSWALSVGLEASKAQSSSRARRRGPTDVDAPSGLSCAEAPSLGESALRMVCAASDADLAHLLPVAARAVPNADVGTAPISLMLHTRALCGVDDGSIRAKIAGWLSGALGVPSMNARFDAQFDSVATALTRELCDIGEDLDSAVIGASLLPHAEGFDVTGTAPAGVRRSALSRLLLGGGASGIAPLDFWYAHAGSEEAGFLWAFEPGPIERWRQPLGELLGTALAFRGVPPQLGRQARYLFESLPVPRAPIVHASGPIPSTEREASAPWLERLGWQLYVVRGSFAEYQYYVSELVKAFNDPILGPQFGRLLRAALGPSASPQRVRQRRPVAGARLPRSSFTLEVTLAPLQGTPSDEAEADGARSAAQRALFAVVAPDEEDGVKIAWGGDERFLVSLLADPARMPAASTLASRPGLGELHQHRALAGGFVSLAAMLDLMRPMLAPPVAQHHPSGVERTPHLGATPIVYEVTQSSEAAPLSLRAHVPREALVDLLFFVSELRHSEPPGEVGAQAGRPSSASPPGSSGSSGVAVP